MSWHRKLAGNAWEALCIVLIMHLLTPLCEMEHQFYTFWWRLWLVHWCLDSLLNPQPLVNMGQTVLLRIVKKWVKSCHNQSLRSCGCVSYWSLLVWFCGRPCLTSAVQCDGKCLSSHLLVWDIWNHATRWWYWYHISQMVLITCTAYVILYLIG